MIGSRTSRAGGEVWAAQLVIHREQPRRDIENQHRNHERRETAGSSAQQNFVLLSSGLKPADTGAQKNANLVTIHLVQVEARIAERLPAGMDAELRVAVRTTHFFWRRKRRARVKVFYLGRNLSIK